MSHPLQRKVKAVGRRARLLAVFHALGWCAAFVLAAAFFMGLADYLFRIHDQGVRFICSSGVLLMLASCIYCFAYPVAAYRLGDVQLAQRIERRFPQLRNELSSSIAFLQQREDDATAGSNALRQAVIAETEGKMKGIELAECLDAGSAIRALWAAAAVCLATGAVCMLDLHSAQLAGRRLLTPWSDAPWPRRNRLEFLNPPTQLGKGDDFEAELIDRNGRLPTAVEIQYCIEGEGERILVRQMNMRGDKMVHRLENVTRPFRYRAVGGDDDTMDWIPLQVDEPPRLSTLRVRIHPPEYTGWRMEETVDPFLSVLEGTRLEMEGRGSKPLAAAKLVMQSGKETVEAPASLDADGCRFVIPANQQPPWIVRESVTYWFELKGKRTGLTGGDKTRWEIRVAADAPPSVSWDKPAMHSFVTAEAMTTLSANVEDDLAIHSVELRYRRSDQDNDGERSIALYRGPDRAPAASVDGSNRSGGLGEKRLAAHCWDLAKLPGLAPGDWIEYHVAAADYRPQLGRSATQRFIIISVDELEDRIAQQQAYILSQLSEILRRQQASRSQVASLETQLQEVGRFDKTDIDRLQSAELNQREVARMVSHEQEGVQRHIVGVLNDLERNRDRPEVARRMRELLDYLQRINLEQMPVIQQQMTAALKIARNQLQPSSDGPTQLDRPSDAETAASALGEAGRRQDSVIRVLEQLLAQLTQWDSYRRFSREISRLRHDQEAVLRRSESLRLETLTKHVRDLSPQEAADLKRLAQRQNELARSLDKIQSRMAEMKASLQEDEPLAAETIADALDTAQRSEIVGRMRESSRSVEQNQLGNAAGHQNAVLQSLQDVLDTLANRREPELTRIAKRLREADGELADLRRTQGQILEEMEEAAKIADLARRSGELERLAPRNAELAKRLDRLARRLKRLQARRSAEATAQAAAMLRESAQAGEQGDSAQSLEKARQAGKQLEEAQRQLAEEMTRTEQDLSREQLRRLDEAVSALSVRQQSILDETDNLERIRTRQDGRRTRPQAAFVRELADRQQGLGVETDGLGNALGKNSAFALGLQAAGREMAAAAKGLERGETNGQTQPPQRRALHRLQQLLVALQPDLAQNTAKDAGDSQSGSSEGPPVDAPQLAELKLVRLMQEEVFQRTSELMQQKRRDGGLAAPELSELDELGQRQGRLADIVLGFAKDRKKD